jgi:hypothetical protein
MVLLPPRDLGLASLPRPRERQVAGRLTRRVGLGSLSFVQLAIG